MTFNKTNKLYRIYKIHYLNTLQNSQRPNIRRDACCWSLTELGVPRRLLFLSVAEHCQSRAAWSTAHVIALCVSREQPIGLEKRFRVSEFKQIRCFTWCRVFKHRLRGLWNYFFSGLNYDSILISYMFIRSWSDKYESLTTPPTVIYLCF